MSVRKAEDVNGAVATGGAVEITGTQITGDLAFEENREPIAIDRKDIAGSVQANKNVGGLSITDNVIGNGLQCQDDSPFPVGGGNIAKQKQGQCALL